MEPPRPTSVLRFGTYEVSFQSGEVRKAGLRIRVQQQPMKLLEMLLQRPGEVVTREELCRRVWPNENFGDFDMALNIAIGKLRSALGDSAENPRYIETLPKRGYRFIADVSVVDGDSRTKRPESAAGDLPETAQGNQFQSNGSTVAPAPRQRVGRCAQTAVAEALGHRRPGTVPGVGDSRSLAISFAWPSAHRHPILGGTSAGQPLWRCFTELLRRRHDGRADH